jgi:hypothetical protein
VQGDGLYFCFKSGVEITLERSWKAASVRTIGLILESNSGPSTLKPDRSVIKLLSSVWLSWPHFV